MHDRSRADVWVGPQHFEKLLADMLLAQPETERVHAALARWMAAESPIRNAQQNLTALAYTKGFLIRWIATVRSILAGSGERTCILEEFQQKVAHGRRVRGRLLRVIPARYFIGLPLEIPADDARRVVMIERKAIPDAPDAENALALLPVAWLRAMHEFHDQGKRPRTRVLLAAKCAAPLYEPSGLRNIIEQECGADHLRFLARVIASGLLSEEALSPEERTDLQVDFEWRQPAAGIGGRLRQLGFLFLGMQGGRRTLYVPESARPVMALIVGNVLLEREVQGAAQIAETLQALSIQAVQARMRRVAFCAPGLVQAEGLPSRRSRIRYKTPGPDRVVELEVVLRGSKPRVLRRIRISYRRPVGALHEAIQLAFGLPDTAFHCLQAFGPGRDDCRAFFDPDGEYPLKADRDEWRISIREALAYGSGALVYMYGRPNESLFDIRRIALHLLEQVPAEPRVVWADGVLAPVERADTSDSQASLDAANVFLEQLDV